MILAIMQSSVILFLALGMVRLLRRQPAAVRHAILAGGLISSLIAPVFGHFLPETQMARGPAVYLHEKWQRLWPPSHDEAGLITVREIPRHENDQSATVLIASSRDLSLTPRIAPGRLFLWIWFGGATVAGMVLISGTVRIVLLVIRSKPLVLTKWSIASKEIAHALRLQRPFELLRNDRAILGTWGIVRPKLFLPADAATWSDQRLRLVLTHELAHIKRLDWAIQLVAEMARAVYWFNPLYWLACRVLRSESEHACDDVVLNTGFDAKDYAAHLLELARTLKNSGRAAVLAMARGPDLERRFVAMLNPSLNHRSVSRVTLLSIFAAVICITLPLAAMRAPKAQQAAPPPSASLLPRTPVSQPAVPAPSRVAAKPAGAKGKPVQGLADGTLAGTVYDSSGAVIPGVTVTVAGRMVQVEALTDEAGRYELRTLVPGVYTVVAQHPGFVTVGKRVEIASSQTSRGDMTLNIGSIAETVRVNAAGQPRSAPPSAGPTRIRVGGNVRAANLIYQVRPVYPQSAQEAGIEGTVRVQGIISPDGTLIGLRALNKVDTDLTNAALEALTQWRYRPTLLNGEPVGVSTQIDVEFKLGQ